MKEFLMERGFLIIDITATITLLLISILMLVNKYEPETTKKLLPPALSSIAIILITKYFESAKGKQWLTILSDSDFKRYLSIFVGIVILWNVIVLLSVEIEKLKKRD